MTDLAVVIAILGAISLWVAHNISKALTRIAAKLEALTKPVEDLACDPHERELRQLDREFGVDPDWMKVRERLRRARWLQLRAIDRVHEDDGGGQ